MKTPTTRLSRRHALQGGAALGLAAAGAARAAATKKSRGKIIPLAFNDPIWNRETRARLEGDTAPGKFVHGYATGIVHAVMDDKPVRPLFGFEVFSGIRVLRQPDGSYQRLCRELVFYRDLETGEMMDGAPGHIYDMGKFSSIESPDKWVDPSLSSLENYARTEKPQPPKAKT